MVNLLLAQSSRLLGPSNSATFSSSACSSTASIQSKQSFHGNCSFSPEIQKSNVVNPPLIAKNSQFYGKQSLSAAQYCSEAATTAKSDRGRKMKKNGKISPTNDLVKPQTPIYPPIPKSKLTPTQQTQMVDAFKRLPLTDVHERKDHRLVWRWQSRQLEIEQRSTHLQGQINKLLSPETLNWQRDAHGRWVNIPMDPAKVQDKVLISKMNDLVEQRYPEANVPEYNKQTLFSLRECNHDLYSGPQPRLSPNCQEIIDKLVQGGSVRDEFIQQFDVEEESPPFDGAEELLEWKVSLVLHSGPYDFHPRNQEVTVRFHLNDLQKQFNISNDGVQHIIRIVSWIPSIHRTRDAYTKKISSKYENNPMIRRHTTRSWYHPKSGMVTFWTWRHPNREDNRRHLVNTIHKLVSVAHRDFPVDAPPDTSAFDHEQIAPVVAQEPSQPYWPYKKSSVDRGAAKEGQRLRRLYRARKLLHNPNMLPFIK